MKAERRDFVLWAPRIVGLGLAAFLAMFALDALSGSHGLLATIVALLMGLIPAIITLTAVAVGWKHQGAAAIMFLVGAVFYAVNALEHPDWILIITGPLVLEAALFYLSWRQSKSGKPTPETV